MKTLTLLVTLLALTLTACPGAKTPAGSDAEAGVASSDAGAAPAAALDAAK